MVLAGLLRITIPPPFSPLSHSTQMSSLHSTVAGTVLPVERVYRTDTPA